MQRSATFRFRSRMFGGLRPNWVAAPDWRKGLPVGDSHHRTEGRALTSLRFRRLHPDESKVNLRQGIEVSGLCAKLLRLSHVAFALIGLTQTIKIVRILLVSLLQFRHRVVVVLRLQRNHSEEFVSLSCLEGILQS